MTKLGGVSVFTLTLVATGLYVGAVRADWYAHADFSACPSQYVPESSGQEGPFSSEQECEARIQSVESSSPMACAQYSCEDDGSDSGSDSSGPDLSSLPVYTGGLSSQQSMAMGIGMLGAFMIGEGLHKLLYGNPQQQAAEQAQQAAQRARQAAEQEKQANATRQRLLGEIMTDEGDTHALTLKDASPDTGLQLMTGSQALSPIAMNSPDSKTPPAKASEPKHSDAFNRGYFDGSQCYSHNAGPYCNGLTGKTWQVCLSDYRAGYQVGTDEMNMKVKDATKLGLLDEESGKPNNGFSETPAVGDCRTQLNQAYNNGYGKGLRNKLSGAANK